MSLRRNILANYGARGGAAIIAIVVPPIYVRLMGIESYGLVGLFATLTSILNLLDLGLSSTLSKEVARLSADPTRQGGQLLRDTIKSFEYVFWAIAWIGCLAVVAAAPAIAGGWLKVEHLPVASATRSIRLMGAIFALQWPASMYVACLLALQRQVVANALTIAFAVVKAVGAICLLRFVAPRVEIFFAWQLVATTLHAFLANLVLRTGLAADGGSSRAKFRRDLLARNWRFSAGMAAISLLAMGLTQVDKVIVSRMVSLEQFGYYGLAWTLAGGLTTFSAPLFVAIFPRMVQLVESRDEPELARIYHDSTQLLAAMLCAGVMVCTVFGRELLVAWVGQPETVAATYPMVLPIVIGTAFNALMNLPYALQVAHGWTRLTVVTNAISIFVIAPLTYVLTKRLGAAGAGIGWAVLNVGYFAFQVRFVHGRLLKGELNRWYGDVALPFLGALAPAIVMRQLVATTAVTTRASALAVVGVVGLLSALGASLLAASVRTRALAALSRVVRRREGFS